MSALESSATTTDVRRTVRTHYEKNGHTQHVEVSMIEVLDADYGLYVWPSALVLADFLVANADLVSRAHIVEIGAGVSLPGIIAAKLGCSNLVLSDHPAYANVLSLCNRALEVNSIGGDVATVEGLCWGRLCPVHQQLAEAKPDLLIAADCFYDTKDFKNIVVTVAYFLEANPRCRFITTYHERSANRTVSSLLAEWGLEGRRLESPPRVTMVVGKEHVGCESVTLFEVIKTSPRPSSK